MIREVHQWYSQALNKEMPIAVYGHYGFSLLMVPTAAADYLEYERFELIDQLKPFLDAGKLKIFSINSINTESWMNKEMEGAHKAIRQNQFNEYVFNEVIPFNQINDIAGHTHHHLWCFIRSLSFDEPFSQKTRPDQWCNRHERGVRPDGIHGWFL